MADPPEDWREAQWNDEEEYEGARQRDRQMGKESQRKEEGDRRVGRKQDEAVNKLCIRSNRIQME